MFIKDLLLSNSWILPLDARIIDPDFESEHAAVRLLGGSAMLFDFDILKRNQRKSQN